MATDKPEETAPTEPAIVSEAPKQRPWLKILAVVVVVVVVISAVAYLMWPRNRAPTISQAAVSSQTADVNQALTFTAQANDPDGNALTYTWDFGDNTTGTGAEVTHAYAMSGKFIALLTVTDGQGGVVTNDNNLIFVQVSHLISEPTADAQTGPAAAVLSADHTVVEAGTTVKFNSNSSWAYVWSATDTAYSAVFGGDTVDMFSSVVYNWADTGGTTTGNITTVGQITHTFSKEGNWLNKLTVTIANGPTGPATASYGYTVRVQPAAPVVQVKNPDIFTEVTIGEPQYLDPAVDYETAGGEVLQNVYETLVWYQEGSEGTTVLVPRLATVVPTTDNGGISADGLNYTFNIRTGVKFHDGTTMSPDDVVYSFLRALWIHDPDGPSWMMEAVMDGYLSYYVGAQCGATGKQTCMVGDWVNDTFGGDPAAVSPWFLPALPSDTGTWDTTVMTVPMAMALMNTTVVKGTAANTVIVHLIHAYPAFLYISAYTVMSIVSKSYIMAHGGDSWGTQNEWMNRHTSGTGPFEMTTWEPNQVIILTRWDQYWRTPATIQQVNIVKFNDIASREFALFAGDADIAAIDRNYQYDIIKQDKTVKDPNINVTMDKPTFDVMFLGFNQNISEANLPPGYPLKVPATFYSDAHIRRAFSYAFDYDTFISTVVYGGGVQANGPIPDGMLGYNSSIPKYAFDMTKAKSELALAINPATGHSYLQDGFEITLFYNAGNNVRQEGCQLLKTALESLNGQSGVGQITVNVQALDWPVYLSASQHRGLPLFFLGWAPDYADPDDYVVPFLSGTTGTFAMRQSYDNPTIDTMIAQAAAELDQTKREKLYMDMTAIAYLQDVPDIFVYQATNFHVQRSWVHGYWYNPMLSGGYFYSYSKG